MSIVHTPLPLDAPGRHGEFKWGEYSSQLQDDELEVWFNLNYLNGVGDIDSFICHPTFGAVAVEVKGHSLHQISGYSRSRVEFNDGKSGHPGKQAHHNAQRLKSWLDEQVRMLGDNPLQRSPWVHSVACWPNIARAEWKTAFRQSPEAVNDADHMIFADDLTLPPKEFISLVERLISAPLFGNPVPQTMRIESDRYRFFVPILKAQTELVRPNLTQTPVSKLIPNIVKASAGQKRYFEGDTRVDIIFTGPPGTGKTMQLARAGIEAARKGLRVLYLCYNKTLAAEMRREFSRSLGGEATGEVLVTHVHSLTKFVLGRKLKQSEYGVADNYLDSALKLVQENGSEIEFELFDVALIDESQDMEQAAYGLIDLACKPNYSRLVAFGAGQELYGEQKSAPALDEWKKSAKEIVLRRNFRSNSQAFYTYQALFHYYSGAAMSYKALPKLFNDCVINPKVLESAKQWTRERVEKNVKPIVSDVGNFLEIEFEQTGKIGPQLTLTRNQDIRALVESMLRDLAGSSSGESINGLILVASGRSPSYKAVTQALEAQQLEYMDLVPNGPLREEMPKDSCIRIVTHMNARGLSADFTLVLDYEEIYGPNQKNISYVVLSRSSNKTTVKIDGNPTLLPKSSLLNQVHEFVAELLP